MFHTRHSRDRKSAQSRCWLPQINDQTSARDVLPVTGGEDDAERDPKARLACSSQTSKGNIFSSPLSRAQGGDCPDAPFPDESMQAHSHPQGVQGQDLVLQQEEAPMHGQSGLSDAEEQTCELVSIEGLPALSVPTEKLSIPRQEGLAQRGSPSQVAAIPHLKAEAAGSIGAEPVRSEAKAARPTGRKGDGQQDDTATLATEQGGSHKREAFEGML